MANTQATGGAKRGVGETRGLVLDLFRTGKGAREIAGELEISTQAVNQHLRSLRDAGELPEEGVA
jgi:predicted transcriptional regulator